MKTAPEKHANFKQLLLYAWLAGNTNSSPTGSCCNSLFIKNGFLFVASLWRCYHKHTHVYEVLLSLVFIIFPIHSTSSLWCTLSSSSKINIKRKLFRLSFGNDILAILALSKNNSSLVKHIWTNANLSSI